MLCLKCHSQVEFPFTTPQGHRVGRPTKGSYIYQLPPDAVYHPHHLRTTPTAELSNTHTKTLPAGSDGAGRATDGGWTQNWDGRRDRETARVEHEEPVSHQVGIILFTGSSRLVCPKNKTRDGGERMGMRGGRGSGCCQRQLG